MYTLYHGAGSCSLAVKAALSLTQQPFTTHLVDLAAGEHLSSEYLAISPLGKVPALQLTNSEQDEVLTEGAAILLYLAAQHPGANLMPSSNHPHFSTALKWLQVFYSTVHPHWARVFFPERYGHDTASIRASAEHELDLLYALIDTQLTHSAFIAGDALSLGDLYLMVSLHWEGALSIELTHKYPALAAYKQQMYQQPVIGLLYQSEFDR